MTIIIPVIWSRVRGLPDADPRRSRQGRVLQAAISNTRYAREYDPHAPLDALPRIALHDFLAHPDRFSNTKARRAKKHRFEYPAGPAPKTAVVGRNIEETWKIKHFKSLRSERLIRFAPHSIAAPIDMLRAHCDSAAPLKNALIPFSGILQGPLSAEDGDLFWSTYQVPVFQQFLGLDGELLAAECELHHGLHIREEAAFFAVDAEDGVLEVSFLANARLPIVRLDTGLSARVVADACPCGDPSPRLVDLKRRPAERMKPRMALAASAAAVS